MAYNFFFELAIDVCAVTRLLMMAQSKLPRLWFFNIRNDFFLNCKYRSQTFHKFELHARIVFRVNSEFPQNVVLDDLCAQHFIHSRVYVVLCYEIEYITESLVVSMFIYGK